jgi:hypothetical protein
MIFAPKGDPPTQFDWAIYADATFAGLSTLIPVPLLDLAYMWFFRRRMPRVIAKRHGLTLDPSVLELLAPWRAGCRRSCLTWPLGLLWSFIKRLSRKIIYFLTIKEAVDQLNYHWHWAFLLDYALDRGHLVDAGRARLAAAAIEETLGNIAGSPLLPLARQIITGPLRIWRTLRRARRGQEDAVVDRTRSRMARGWDSFADYFTEVAAHYDEIYAQLKHLARCTE